MCLAQGLIWWLNLKFSKSKHRILILFLHDASPLTLCHLRQWHLSTTRLLKPFRSLGVILDSFSFILHMKPLSNFCSLYFQNTLGIHQQPPLPPC